MYILTVAPKEVPNTPHEKANILLPVEIQCWWKELFCLHLHQNDLIRGHASHEIVLQYSVNSKTQ